MNILEVAQGLHAKAADDSTRSKASRLREVIDSVETALNAGVSRSEVIKELSSHGLVFTLRTFETTLGRIREKRNDLRTPIN